MTLVLVGVAAIAALLAAIFGLTYWQAGASKRPLAGPGRNGLLAVLLALGVFMVGASLAAGLTVFVLAPLMLGVGLVLLVLAGLAALAGIALVVGVLLLAMLGALVVGGAITVSALITWLSR